LKELTELLVYVPYFVSDTDIPAPFIFTNGCMHVGKVILQSEESRWLADRVWL